jgi:hypothetical protein
MIFSLQGMAHNIFLASSPDDIQANTTNRHFEWKLRGFVDFRFAVTRMSTTERQLSNIIKARRFRKTMGISILALLKDGSTNTRTP